MKDLIETAGELLPSQGPITAFVFLNTIQALEDLPFDEGLVKGARLFGCQPYLSEEQYREKFAKNRIRDEDLVAIVDEDLGSRGEEVISDLVTRRDLRLAMLRYPLRMGPTPELRWFIEETDALKHLRPDAPIGTRERLVEQTRQWIMRDLHGAADPTGESSTTKLEQRTLLAMASLLNHFGSKTIEDWSLATWEEFALRALWRVCRDGVHGAEPLKLRPRVFIRHRDALLAATGEDSDELTHSVLTRYCPTFIDQGFADWTLPHKERGFYRAFLALYRQPLGPPAAWQKGLAAELARLDDNNVSPLDSIIESLDDLGVSEREWKTFLQATILALRGWAGLLRQAEVRADRVAFPAPAGTFIEFLAVRLILDRFALRYIAEHRLPSPEPLPRLRDLTIGPAEIAGIDQRGFLLFQLAQLLGWTPQALYRLTKPKWLELIDEIEAFHTLQRRRVLHQAFERRIHCLALDAVAIHSQSRPPERVKSPRFQIVTCIDTREESFRRHLEEVSPDVETFSAAGFFGVPIYYRGVADAHFAPLCPIVVTPQHWLCEDVVYLLEASHRRRAKTRRAIGSASHQIHVGSRKFAAGALLTAGLGVLASIPLVARVLFPRLTANVKKTAGRFVSAPSMTRLRLERTAEQPGSTDDAIGFSLAEMANFGERTLRDIGLINNFSRLVIFLGHGSFCLNNPHKSAYDCGACCGMGGPNGRALAMMLNDPRVRMILAERGLPIPATTLFLSGMHNTCVDSITYFDLDLLPKSHTEDFLKARDTLERTCESNAHERCRRFESAPLNLSLAAARRHVSRRAEDLAETRPEYGNATNAICIVGRRARTRGLYLDRRSFLMSYDPESDYSDYRILARTLGAVVPVCEGINMQYTLSAIDSPGWGSGTKLPHNVTALLGVMDGAESDLRPGLPWQGVEIHEPVRLQFIIETTPEAMFHIMNGNPLVNKILRNQWVKLALLDPQTAQISVFRGGEFHPYTPQAQTLPTTPTSISWYRGWRDNLEFAQLVPSAGKET